MKKVYIFSGLGADRRVFQFINFSGLDTIFINWLTPTENETIEDYALRLTDQIKTDKPILVGLSFGGIIATEVAKLIDTEKIVLIASAQTRKEIPFYFRLAGELRLHRLLPTRLLKQPNFLSNWFFGTENQTDKKLLADILWDTDPIFLKWAIDKIVNWTNATRHKNIRQIHGTSDRILPIFFTKFDVKVSGGGHFMTVNKASELTRLIRNEIA